jgi:hypothetical protein
MFRGTMLPPSSGRSEWCHGLNFYRRANLRSRVLMVLREGSCEDGSDLGSHPMVGFGFSGLYLQIVLPVSQTYCSSCLCGNSLQEKCVTETALSTSACGSERRINPHLPFWLLYYLSRLIFFFFGSCSLFPRFSCGLRLYILPFQDSAFKFVWSLKA